MSTFEVAMTTLLPLEGGFSDHPNDKGGPTKFGISLSFLAAENIHVNDDSVIDIKDVQDLTIDKATAIYKQYFWDKYGYSQIYNQVIATYIFIMCVNIGSFHAHQLLQRACWALGGYQIITDDGILGSATFEQVNKWGSDLLPPLKSECANYYRAICNNNPSQKVFLNGWLKRAYQ